MAFAGNGTPTDGTYFRIGHFYAQLSYQIGTYKQFITLLMLLLRFIRSTLSFRKARNRFLHTPYGIQTTAQGFVNPEDNRVSHLYQPIRN